MHRYNERKFYCGKCPSYRQKSHGIRTPFMSRFCLPKEAWAERSASKAGSLRLHPPEGLFVWSGFVFFLNSPTFLLFILCFSGFFLLSSQVLAQEINPHLGRRFADRKRSFCETVGSACQHDTQITGWSVCFFASLLFASLLFALCFVYFLPSLCIGMYGSHFDWMISSEPISFQQKAN